jgi:hypothetical protein
MRFSRKLLLLCYGLGVAMIFAWAPWTNKAGYCWLWTGPKPHPLASYDMLADARQRLESEYQANNVLAVGEKWLKAIEGASAEDKNNVRQQAKRAVQYANIHSQRIGRVKYMPDSELAAWLRDPANFELVFPEKANLDAAGRQQLFDQWRLTISLPKEWNERIQYSNIDFTRIAMELASLTALLAAGFVMTIRR